MIELKWESRDLKVWRSKSVEKAITRALSKAGGDAIRALRAESKRQVRNSKRIRAGYLANKSLPLSFPKGVKEIGNLVWTMRVSGKPVPLGEFPRRQTRKGVTVEVNKGQRKLIAGAFLATNKSGRKGVFLRPTEARYPMGHRLGPNVAQTMDDKVMIHYIQLVAERRFKSSFDRLLSLELAK
jgi:hypothetical protein